MTGKDIIKELMEKQNVTNVQLANRLGLTQATMWARLNNQSIRDLQLSAFDEMLNALGYEIVIRKKQVQNRQDEQEEMPVRIDEPIKPEGRGRPRKTDTPTPGPDGSDQP